jgi:hypothetical protein
MYLRIERIIGKGYAMVHNFTENRNYIIDFVNGNTSWGKIVQHKKTERKSLREKVANFYATGKWK